MSFNPSHVGPQEGFLLKRKKERRKFRDPKIFSETMHFITDSDSHLVISFVLKCFSLNLFSVCEHLLTCMSEHHEKVRRGHGLLGAGVMEDRELPCGSGT